MIIAATSFIFIEFLGQDVFACARQESANVQAVGGERACLLNKIVSGNEVARPFRRSYTTPTAWCVGRPSMTLTSLQCQPKEPQMAAQKYDYSRDVLHFFMEVLYPEVCKKYDCSWDVLHFS